MHLESEKSSENLTENYHPVTLVSNKFLDDNLKKISNTAAEPESYWHT